MKYLFFLFVTFSSFTFAQSSERTEIEKTINQLFDGMRNSDSAAIKSAFAQNAILEGFDKIGNIKTESVTEFANSAPKFEKGSLYEKITFGSVLIDGNLASVWTPYEFFYKGKFSHCGVNSFTMIKEEGKWKIQYLIDTKRKDNCVK